MTPERLREIADNISSQLSAQSAITRDLDAEELRALADEMDQVGVSGREIASAQMEGIVTLLQPLRAVLGGDRATWVSMVQNLIIEHQALNNILVVLERLAPEGEEEKYAVDDGTGFSN
ncbi:MAG: hypothetical protein NVS1B6_04380 [Steroidobacteraceae bacterium]